MTLGYLFLLALAVVAIYFGVRYFVRRHNFSGERVVICPETGKQAMVELDAGHAALTSLIGQTDLRLENCWRWPMSQNCGQECLLQLNDGHEDCQVRSVLEKWYRGKQCAFCHRTFDEVRLIDHKPALLNRDGISVEWKEIPLAAVREAMATYRPVCWNCHIALSFRREHPDLVVERRMH